MPTKITQVEDLERGKMILRVEGSLTLDDAVLLEKIAMEMREGLQRNITLDLADIDFLDSESATVLKRLSQELGFELEGLEFFLQNAISQVEKRSKE
ncbi:MAG: STAS domain-containing protein [Acidobacteria bacterium]|nr:MAG: STAS domain-containing protein [Acidobacteriota bacterium]